SSSIQRRKRPQIITLPKQATESKRYQLPTRKPLPRYRAPGSRAPWPPTPPTRAPLGLPTTHLFSRGFQVMLNRGSRFPPRHGFSPADCRARKFAALAAATILLLIHPAHAQPITFRDITSQAGIRFIHNNAAFGKKYLPETLGPGCAFIDYDNDRYPDILLINGEDWPGHAKMGPTTLKLYHNNQDGTFTDVTRKAGLAVPMFGLGVAIGDYDNDGHEDIFITTLGQSHLFHNNGRGTFSDMTKAAGL